MKKKTQYRIRNWPAYNAAPIGRGSLTLWVDEDAIGNHAGSDRRDYAGRPAQDATVIDQYAT